MDAPRFTPEDKKVALALGLLLAAGLGVLFLTGVLLPWLVVVTGLLTQLAENTIAFVVMLGLGVFAILNYQNIFYGMMSAVQAIRKRIIAVNPVYTLNTAMDRMHKKLDQIAKAISEADAAKNRMKLRIRNPAFSTSLDTNDALNQAGALDKAEREERLAQQAKKTSQPDEVIAQHATAADRYRAQAATFQPQVDRLEKMLLAFKKANSMAIARLADMENQKDILTTNLEAQKDGAKATGLFKGIFGRSPELTMAQASVDEIVKQTTEAEAEIDQFLEAIQPQIEAEDLKHGAAVDAAIARFNTVADAKQITAGPVPVSSKAPVKDAQLVNR